MAIKYLQSRDATYRGLTGPDCTAKYRSERWIFDKIIETQELHKGSHQKEFVYLDELYALMAQIMPFREVEL